MLMSTTAERKNISMAIIRRLPRYYRYLGELKAKGVERISSGDLSRLMNVTASQIRQDLNHFGGFGQQGSKVSLKPFQRLAGVQRAVPSGRAPQSAKSHTGGAPQG